MATWGSQRVDALRSSFQGVLPSFRRSCSAGQHAIVAKEATLSIRRLVKKYGEELKGAISSAIRGNYKRLAVAWVDLPDQLAQPDKPIEVPKTDEELEAEAEAKAAREEAMRAAYSEEA